MSDTVRHSLPIFGTIKRTFFFVVQDFGPIVRLTWFPLLLAAAVQSWAGQFQLTRQLEGLAQNKSPLALFTGQEIGMIAAAGILASFFTAVAVVALLRIVLYGDRKPSAYIHFAVGRAEFFVFLFPVLLALVFFFAMIILAIAVFGAEGARELANYAALLGTAGENRFAVLGTIMLIFVLIFWIMIRISLYGPSIVARGRIDLDDIVGVTSWRFWPLLATYVLTGLFIGLILAVVAMIAFAAGLNIEQIGMMDLMAADQLPGQQRMNLAQMTAALKYQLDNVYMFAAINFGFGIIGTAIGAGLTGFAYRALKGIAPDQRLPE
ncbi:MAG TPA: hypothetical protein PL096_11055 [Micropepsaceae bacterium]|nr:hypothetical protein [Micropepsaceae bacterium]